VFLDLEWNNFCFGAPIETKTISPKSQCDSSLQKQFPKNHVKNCSHTSLPSIPRVLGKEFGTLGVKSLKVKKLYLEMCLLKFRMLLKLESHLQKIEIKDDG